MTLMLTFTFLKQCNCVFAGGTNTGKVHAILRRFDGTKHIRGIEALCSQL